MLKFFTFLILIIFALGKVDAIVRYCKRQVLGSLEFESLDNAVEKNALCPDIEYNCCGNWTILKMYKQWHQISYPLMQKNFELTIEGFQKLKKFQEAKDEILLGKVIDVIKEHKEYEFKYYEHLSKLQDEFENIPGSDIEDDLDQLVETEWKKLFDFMVEYRKSVNCALCNYEDQLLIDNRTYTVTYHGKFCTAFAEKYIDILDKLYTNLMKAIVLLDEFHFYVTNQRLIEDDDERNDLKKFVNIVEKCHKSERPLSKCFMICKEFNLNAFSKLLDGNNEFIDDFLQQFAQFYTEIQDPENYVEQFYDTEPQDSFDDLLDDSFLTSNVVLDNLTDDRNQNFIDLLIQENKDVHVVKKGQNDNYIEADDLRNILDAKALYQQRDDPVDISNYAILINNNIGINFLNHIQNTNFDLTKEFILSMLDSKTNNMHSVNEVMEKRVIDATNKITVKTMQKNNQKKRMMMNHRYLNK